MPVSRMTAMRIASTEVACQAGGPNSEGKWTGWIMGDRSKERWDPILNSEAIYDSKDDAIAAMEKVIQEIRDMNLDPSEFMRSTLGDEVAQTVAEVVRLSKEP